MYRDRSGGVDLPFSLTAGDAEVFEVVDAMISGISGQRAA
jgi:hypothetical protein